jgi:uncharacterized protein YegL
MASSSTPNLPKTSTSAHPQTVVIVIDNSGSMKEKGKCKQVTDAIQDLVMTVQSLNQGASYARVMLSMCSVGDNVRELAVAAQPNDIDLNALTFEGDQGGTELHLALKWAKDALEKSLDHCRKFIPHYAEHKSPDPLLVVLTDGEFEIEPCRPYIEALRNVQFKGGQPQILGVGVEVERRDYAALKEIASTEEYAIQIGSQEIAAFLGELTETVTEVQTLSELAARRR